MADTPSEARGEFHAAIHQVEPGVFRAEYRAEVNPEDPDDRELPDFHLGTSVADAKTWVEQMALGLGYRRVVWDAMPQ
jgi:hypothetical protein